MFALGLEKPCHETSCIKPNEGLGERPRELEAVFTILSYCDDSLHLSLKTSCSQLLLVLVYNGGVAVQVVPSQRLDLRQTRLGSATHAKIPEIARSMPNTDRSFAFLPLVAHPRATMEHVLMCPTTVLLTAPAPATMKNCEMLIRLAITPL